MSILSSTKQDTIIGHRLLSIREVFGLTQIDMAERLGITSRAYANYERGEREMPLAVLRELYERFGIDPVWIMTGPGDVPLMAGQRQIDTDLLERVILLVEEGLRKSHRTLKPDKMARLIRLAHEHCAEQGAVDAPRVREMLSLAA